MRLVRSLTVIVFAAVLAAAVLAVPAGAAPLPVVLGQVGTAFTTGSATGWGGCDCTVAQMKEVSPTANSYVIPYDGVIVAGGTYVGHHVEADDSDTVQMQTVNRTGAANGTVVSGGIAHHILGMTPNAVNRFRDRLPAHAGDVLAARFHVNGYIEETPYFFKSTGSADEVVKAAPAVTGGSLLAGFLTAERRVNLEAVLEPDEDHDGYGDYSQDLCPGSPIAISACTGSLFGSDLQGEESPKPPTCACLYIQTSLGGVSTAATSPGVIVRWRVLNGSSGPYRLDVVSDNPGAGGGAYHAYHVLAMSDPATVAAPLNSAIQKISSFPARLPVPAGAYIGVSVPGAVPGFQAGPGGQATYSRTEAPFPGIGGVVGESHNGTILYDADVEPDVDGDGYGDVTQDSCPSAASVHEGPCPAPPDTGEGGAPDGGSPSDPSQPVAPPPPPEDKRGEPPTETPLPTISSLAVKPKTFRVKPIDAAPAHGRWGAKVQLSLSAAATVTLTIEAKHGHRLHTHLTKELAAGQNSVTLSGRYRQAGKPAVLEPGAYRLTATPKSSAGTGPPKRTTFTVLPQA